MIVTQLVERSLRTPEAHGSNPVISKTHVEHLFTVKYIEATKK